jgi:DNA polymerase-3 subunit epsilon
MTIRQIVLDTETTGLDPKLGHRIIEIGGVELVNRRLTQRHFHTFLNPEREIDAGATNVHGLTWDDLKDKPRFADRAAQFIEFVRDAQLVIHNAPFDTGFLDAELAQAGLSPLATFCSGVLDTLRLAKDLHPGKRNNLNVLCERYHVDNSGRTLHGALLDAELLADVYLAMTRGQESLAISLDNAADSARAVRRGAGERFLVPVLSADGAELAAHAAYLDFLDRDSSGKTIWRQVPAGLANGQSRVERGA